MAHLKGHIRERFLDLLEWYVNGGHESDPTDYTDELYALAGKLWNCTDQMPRLYSRDLEDLVDHWDLYKVRNGCRYSVGARVVREHIQVERLKAAADGLKISEGPKANAA